jgi:hypothetical protein
MAELKSGTKINSSVAIHQGNDANTITTTQGVNAATLDGEEASAFADASHTHAGVYARSDGATTNNGDIKTSGSNIYMWANGAWRQIYPAVYS